MVAIAAVAAKSPSKMLVKKNQPTAQDEGQVVQQIEAKAKVEEKAEVEGQSIAKEEDLIVKTAKEIENLKEEKAFKMVPSLLDNIDHDYFRLGGVLSMINGQGWFMDKNYENFRAFVESEAGIQYRKAMYLIEIYNGLVESGVLWDQVKSVGWTKMKEIARIITPENVTEWVDLATNMTTLQLQEHIKQKTAGDSAKGEGKDLEEVKKTTTMTFKVHTDQKTTIREALVKCKHETGTDVDSVALEHICLDFLGGDHKLAKVPSLVEFMKSKSVEEVLEAFGQVFPDVEIEATLPE